MNCHERNRRIASVRARLDQHWAALQRFGKIIDAAATGEIPLAALEPTILRGMVALVASELEYHRMQSLLVEEDYSNEQSTEGHSDSEQGHP